MADGGGTATTPPRAVDAECKDAPLCTRVLITGAAGQIGYAYVQHGREGAWAGGLAMLCGG